MKGADGVCELSTARDREGIGNEEKTDEWKVEQGILYLVMKSGFRKKYFVLLLVIICLWGV